MFTPIGLPKGTGIGHHFINAASTTAVYLEVGSRHPDDQTTCSDVGTSWQLYPELYALHD